MITPEERNALAEALAKPEKVRRGGLASASFANITAVTSRSGAVSVSIDSKPVERWASPAFMRIGREAEQDDYDMPVCMQFPNGVTYYKYRLSPEIWLNAKGEAITEEQAKCLMTRKD
jgi:hypothetical protein